MIRVIFFFIALCLLKASSVQSAELKSYDLPSLFRSSTDIVEIQLHKDGQDDDTDDVDLPMRHYRAIVTKTLLGSYKPGDPVYGIKDGQQVDDISEYLVSFVPVHDSQRMVLFIDRHRDIPEGSFGWNQYIYGILIDSTDHIRKYTILLGNGHEQGGGHAEGYINYDHHSGDNLSESERGRLPTLAEFEKSIERMKVDRALIITAACCMMFSMVGMLVMALNDRLSHKDPKPGM